MPDKKPSMPPSGIYDMKHATEATRLVMSILQSRGEPPETMLAVAGMLVRMQADVSGQTIEDALAVVRVFAYSIKRQSAVKG